MTELDRETLSTRFQAVRSVTEDLASRLSPEDQTIQSMPDASPAKWHRAHTTWFFETFVLGEFDKSYTAFDPDFAFLFNSYYEQAGPRHARPNRGMITRPGAAEVGDYRAHVDGGLKRFAENASDNIWQSAAARIEIGLHHEMQHQELLLMDIKHAFSCNPLWPAYHDAPVPMAGSIQAHSWISYDGGLCETGHDGDGFAYDNESPRHRSWLEPFKLGSRLVTNGAWAEFMADGGYATPTLWLSEGWQTVQDRGWEAPGYWRRNGDGDGWSHFTLSGEQAIDPRAPVSHVSYFEADAFARWAGARLPTEAEWEVAAAGLPIGGNLMEQGLYAPQPASGAPETPLQMFGDLWEWTASPYSPYPGFRTPDGALGEYNGKFMVNQMVLRGGACVTPLDQMRASYRNFFPAHTRWHFSGVRLAQDI